MGMVLLTVESAVRPCLADLVTRLGLGPGEVDADFGVVAVDPAAGLYTIRVSLDAAARCGGREGVVGRHEDARVAPFGPLEGEGGEP